MITASPVRRHPVGFVPVNHESLRTRSKRLCLHALGYDLDEVDQLIAAGGGNLDLCLPAVLWATEARACDYTVEQMRLVFLQHKSRQYGGVNKILEKYGDGSLKFWVYYEHCSDINRVLEIAIKAFELGLPE